jgi:hypothetical protein
MIGLNVGGKVENVGSIPQALALQSVVEASKEAAINAEKLPRLNDLARDNPGIRPDGLAQLARGENLGEFKPEDLYKAAAAALPQGGRNETPTDRNLKLLGFLAEAHDPKDSKELGRLAGYAGLGRIDKDGFRWPFTDDQLKAAVDANSKHSSIGGNMASSIGGNMASSIGDNKPPSIGGTQQGNFV